MRRVLRTGPGLLLLLAAAPAFAQSDPPRLTVAYERTRDRFQYRFENPSSFDTAELVPHEFTQTYWGDNHWFVMRGAFRAGGRLLETEVAATPQVSTRGDDYDTFFQPSGDVVVVGTTGGVSLRSWRVAQTISLVKHVGVDWSVGFHYRQDRSEFHPGLKSTQHTQPASCVEEWIYTRETTISRAFGVTVHARRSWEGRSGRLTIAGDLQRAGDVAQSEPSLGVTQPAADYNFGWLQPHTKLLKVPPIRSKLTSILRGCIFLVRFQTQPR